MTLARFLFLLQGWASLGTLLLLAIAAILAARRTKTLHSVIFAFAAVLILSGALMQKLAMPSSGEAQPNGTFFFQFIEPWNTLGRLCTSLGTTGAALGAVVLILALLRPGTSDVIEPQTPHLPDD